MSAKKDLYQPETKTKKRILIADKDSLLAHRLGSQFRDHGYDVKYAFSVSEAKELLEFWKPDLMMVDLILPETNAISLLKFLQRSPKYRPKAVVVSSRRADPTMVERLHSMGADAHLAKPYSWEDAMGFVQKLLAPKQSAVAKRLGTTIEVRKELHLVNLFLKQALAGPRDSTSLHNLMCMLAIRTGALRVSVVQIVDEHKAMVLAANDNALITGHLLDLNLYPEIKSVIRSGQPECIDSTFDSDIMRSAAEAIGRTPYESLAVFPLYSQGKIFGVVSLRLPRIEQTEMEHIRGFGTICSNIISLTMGFQAAI